MLCELKIKNWIVHSERCVAVQIKNIFEQKKLPIYRTDFWIYFWTFNSNVFCTVSKKSSEQKKTKVILWCNLMCFEDLNVQFLHFYYEKSFFHRIIRIATFVQNNLFRFFSWVYDYTLECTDSNILSGLNRYIYLVSWNFKIIYTKKGTGNVPFWANFEQYYSDQKRSVDNLKNLHSNFSKIYTEICFFLNKKKRKTGLTYGTSEHSNRVKSVLFLN